MPQNNNVELRENLQSALQEFESEPLHEASIELLNTLGYGSDKTIEIPDSDPEAFLELLIEHNPNIEINKEKALFDDWVKADILFQLTDEELKKEHTSLQVNTANTQLLQSYLFFAIELKQQDYARGKLIAIARQLNRVFPMPVMVLIKHGELLSVAVINRRQNKMDSEKDVLGKATIIRDISLVMPHTGHIQILSTFALQNLSGIDSFDALHTAWEEILNVELLNKKFYNELSNWYFWAINEVSFPGEPTSKSFFEETGSTDESKLREVIQEHNAKNVIRLLTRFLFVWFIKEKQLIPNELFDPEYLQKEMLKDLSPYHEDGLFKLVNIQSHYYKAILQNLFFATLNQEKGKRAFRRFGQNMNVTNLLRYESCFKDPDKFIELAEKYTPFMNGGLFECLDKPHPTKQGRKGGDVIAYEDGFSDRTDNPLKVPDYLFFGHDEDVDLSDLYGSNAKKYKQAAVKGLINIFNSYKFTIAENTPIDQEIALDPELLGKVFENLLASYNPETKTTARKQTGSFYTPREIVSYMVDESLIAYLKNEVEDWDVSEEALDTKLHELLSYDDSNPFKSNQGLQKKIIRALDNCKILDPACGSGAFPMGILQKMVHILQKVDPKNTYWQELQMDNAAKETVSIFHIENKEAREQKLIEINEAFDQKINDPDYARKLFLIENCIYGVDIQPIATQISKLRFFISLVVDQKVDKNKENFGIRPLPNLETKFVAANTLIGIDNQDGQMTFDNVEIKTLESELIDIRHRIFSAKTPRTKRKLRDEDKEAREKMGKLLIEDGWASKTANRLAGWDPYDQNASSPFFDAEWMFGILDGFDVMIGNPPYIKEYTDRTVFNGVRDNECYQGKMDLWYLFGCKAIDLLKENGFITFIATNNWVTNEGASKFRNKVLSETVIKKFLDFRDFMIFESASIQTMVYLLEKCHLNKYTIDVRKIHSEQSSKKDAEDLLNKRGDHLYLDLQFIPSEWINKRIAFTDRGIEIILEMIHKRSNFSLDKTKEVAQGIVAPQDFLNKKGAEKLNYKMIAGSGVFNLTNTDKERLRLSQKEQGLIEPFYTTNQLSRFYGSSNNDMWIIYTDSSFKNKRSMDAYPNLKKHLDNFTDVITSDNKPYGLHRARKEAFFKGEKIVSLRKCPSRPVFTYTDFDCYVSQTYFVIKTMRINQKYLTALLNSSLISFWLRYRGKMQGAAFQVDKGPLLEIPIYKPKEGEQLIVSMIVDFIIYEMENNNEEHLVVLENIIDGLVFQLYLPDHVLDKQIDIFRFVEKDLLSVLKNRDFKNLSNSEKENIIKQLHTRWTHPDSEVRNRIKLFAVRSPEILKPILDSR